jgi:hypothetical protein
MPECVSGVAERLFRTGAERLHHKNQRSNNPEMRLNLPDRMLFSLPSIPKLIPESP